jgi:hypothetical protein
MHGRHDCWWSKPGHPEKTIRVNNNIVSYIAIPLLKWVILNSRLESTTEITQNKHVKVLHYFVDDIK